jgi:hypothetical protein
LTMEVVHPCGISWIKPHAAQFPEPKNSQNFSVFGHSPWISLIRLR